MIGIKLKNITDLINAKLETKTISPKEAKKYDINNSWETCKENNALPKQIVISYMNKFDLRCPEGTTSPGASICLGQCVKSNTVPINLNTNVNPFNLDSLKNFSDYKRVVLF